MDELRVSLINGHDTLSANQPGTSSTDAPPPNRAPRRRTRLGRFSDLMRIKSRFWQSLKRKRPITVESLDYLPCENEVYFDRLKSEDTVQHRHLYGYSGKTLIKFLLTVLTGVITGCAAMAIALGTLHTRALRHTIVQYLLDNVGFAPAIATYVMICISLVAFASLLVVKVAPGAAGAGVSLVMAYLNGSHVPDLLTPKVLLVKTIGVICGCSANLAVGPEGPMVHVGAAVASTVAYSSILRIPGRFLRRIPFVHHPPTATASLQLLDADHREFVSAGVSAGIAAAFGAPIGGVLFSMEEASTFWSRRVAWRCFVCAVAAAFTISQLNNRVDAGLLSFDSVTYPGHRDWVLQLPLIAITAAVCGLMGATFNVARRTLWAVRASRRRPTLRVLEAVAVIMLTCALFIGTGKIMGRCAEASGAALQWGIPLGCPPGQINDVATLLMGSPEEVIQQVFSLKTGLNPRARSNKGRSLAGADSTAFPRSPSLLGRFLYPSRKSAAAAGAAGAAGSQELGEMEEPDTNTATCTPSSCLFAPTSLLAVALAYLLGTSLASGIAVPGGLFMPSIIMGSTGGAFLGVMFQRIVPASLTVEPGLYALVGACATLAGVFRSSISLVVILVEGTHGVEFLFTLIVAALIANFVAWHVHRDGVYESELERDGTIFFLRHEVPRALRGLRASEIATRDVVTLKGLEAVDKAVSVLRETTHNGFPVLTDGPDGQPVLEGLILRSQLMVLLGARTVCDEEGRPCDLRPVPVVAPSRQGSEIGSPRGVGPPAPSDDSIKASPLLTSPRAIPPSAFIPAFRVDSLMRSFYQNAGRRYRHRRHLLSTPEAVDTVMLDWLAGGAGEGALSPAQSIGGRDTLAGTLSRYNSGRLSSIQEGPAGTSSAPFNPDEPPATPTKEPGGWFDRIRAKRGAQGRSNLGVSTSGPGFPAGAGVPPSPSASQTLVSTPITPWDVVQAGLEASRGRYLDLLPYVDKSCITIRDEASAARVYHVFLSLSLRHLTVVDKRGKIVGIITRKDLNVQLAGAECGGGV